MRSLGGEIYCWSDNPSARAVRSPRRDLNTALQGSIPWRVFREIGRVIGHRQAPYTVALERALDERSRGLPGTRP